jgi:hypothetical protein
MVFRNVTSVLGFVEHLLRFKSDGFNPLSLLVFLFIVEGLLYELSLPITSGLGGGCLQM